MICPRAFTPVVMSITVALAAIGCDQQAPGPQATPSPATPANPSPATAPATGPAAGADGADRSLTPHAGTLALEKRNRISLIAIPFTVEVPSSWVVRSGAGSRIVLHGNSPSGEVEVLLGKQPNVQPEPLQLMLREAAKPSSNPHARSGVTERDGLKIVKQVEPQGQSQDNPDMVPMRWTMQYIVSEGGTEYSVYELNVMGLSQAMFNRDEAFIQAIFDSVRHDPAATQPATP